MVHAEVRYSIKGYGSSPRIKHPPYAKKDKFFRVLKRKRSQLTDKDDETVSPPTAVLDSVDAKYGVEMVPGGKGVSGAGEPICMSAEQCASAAAAAAEILISTPGSSKARQKKFHRHFKNVSPDEKVLNYYSCALVADILLQGHLYITRNYFAFYSNVFGYVTKLLIPTSSVLRVTKEKTAYIIPNAVGITTEEDKHVFGSLLSRDSTYKLMVQVWNAAVAPTPTHVPSLPSKPEEEAIKDELDGCGQMSVMNDEESSLSGSESNLDSKITTASSVDASSKAPKHQLAVEVKSCHDMFSQTQTIPSKTNLPQFFNVLSSMPRSTLILVISTFLLIVLFASAAILLFRIARLQQGFHDESYFNGRSINEVQAFINTNLDHISKVRQSLERLSFLIENGGHDFNKWHPYENANDNVPQHNNS